LTTKAKRDRSVHLASGKKLAESVRCALCDQRSLKLGEDGGNMRHRATLRCNKVNAVGNRHQAERATGELAQIAQRLGCITAEAVQPGDNDSVNVGVSRGKQLRDASTTRALGKTACAADPGVLDDLGKLCPCRFTPGRNATTLRIEADSLNLVLRRAADITESPHGRSD